MKGLFRQPRPGIKESSGETRALGDVETLKAQLEAAGQQLSLQRESHASALGERDKQVAALRELLSKQAELVSSTRAQFSAVQEQLMGYRDRCEGLLISKTLLQEEVIQHLKALNAREATLSRVRDDLKDAEFEADQLRIALRCSTHWSLHLEEAKRQLEAAMSSLATAADAAAAAATTAGPTPAAAATKPTPATASGGCDGLGAEQAAGTCQCGPGATHGGVLAARKDGDTNGLVSPPGAPEAAGAAVLGMETRSHTPGAGQTTGNGTQRDNGSKDDGIGTGTAWAEVLQVDSDPEHIVPQDPAGAQALRGLAAALRRLVGQEREGDMAAAQVAGIWVPPAAGMSSPPQMMPPVAGQPYASSSQVPGVPAGAWGASPSAQMSNGGKGLPWGSPWAGPSSPPSPGLSATFHPAVSPAPVPPSPVPFPVMNGTPASRGPNPPSPTLSSSRPSGGNLPSPTATLGVHPAWTTTTTMNPDGSMSPLQLGGVVSAGEPLLGAAWATMTLGGGSSSMGSVGGSLPAVPLLAHPRKPKQEREPGGQWDAVGRTGRLVGRGGGKDCGQDDEPAVGGKGQGHGVGGRGSSDGLSDAHGHAQPYPSMKVIRDSGAQLGSVATVTDAAAAVGGAAATGPPPSGTLPYSRAALAAESGEPGVKGPAAAQGVAAGGTQSSPSPSPSTGSPVSGGEARPDAAQTTAATAATAAATAGRAPPSRSATRQRLGAPHPQPLPSSTAAVPTGGMVLKPKLLTQAAGGGKARSTGMAPPGSEAANAEAIARLQSENTALRRQLAEVTKEAELLQFKLLSSEQLSDTHPGSVGARPLGFSSTGSTGVGSAGAIGGIGGGGGGLGYGSAGAGGSGVQGGTGSLGTVGGGGLLGGSGTGAQLPGTSPATAAALHGGFHASPAAWGTPPQLDPSPLSLNPHPSPTWYQPQGSAYSGNQPSPPTSSHKTYDPNSQYFTSRTVSGTLVHQHMPHPSWPFGAGSSGIGVGSSGIGVGSSGGSSGRADPARAAQAQPSAPAIDASGGGSGIGTGTGAAATGEVSAAATAGRRQPQDEPLQEDVPGSASSTAGAVQGAQDAGSEGSLPPTSQRLQTDAGSLALGTSHSSRSSSTGREAAAAAPCVALPPLIAHAAQSPEQHQEGAVAAAGVQAVHPARPAALGSPFASAPADDSSGDASDTALAVSGPKPLRSAPSPATPTSPTATAAASSAVSGRLWPGPHAPPPTAALPPFLVQPTSSLGVSPEALALHAMQQQQQQAAVAGSQPSSADERMGGSSSTRGPLSSAATALSSAPTLDPVLLELEALAAMPVVPSKAAKASASSSSGGAGVVGGGGVRAGGARVVAGGVVMGGGVDGGRGSRMSSEGGEWQGVQRSGGSGRQRCSEGGSPVGGGVGGGSSGGGGDAASGVRRSGGDGGGKSVGQGMSAGREPSFGL